MANLDIHSISCSYGNKKVLDDISLSFEPGKLSAIIGPNGAGKSTLLKCAAGILKPQTGEVKLGNLVVHQTQRRRLASQIAFLPQEVSFAFPFRVHEVVEMGTYHRGAHQSSTSRDIQSAMRQTGVGHFENRYFAELSGGEKKRVLIAQALCQKSGVLLLDEPTASLDPKYAKDLFESLKSLALTGTAVVAVTHDLSLASRYADTIIGLHQAKVHFEGAPADMLKHLEDMFETPFVHGRLPNNQTWITPG